MIHLITLNPAIDEYIDVDNLQISSTNYAKSKRKVMGGKAVNVATVLRNLKANAVLITTVDNSDSFVVDSLESYNSFLVPVPSIRTNLKINNQGQITEINDRGLALSGAAKIQFENYIRKCVDPDDIVLIAGNPHPDDEQFQFKLAKQAKECGAKLFLDSNRLTLAMIEELHPSFIKPNDQELEQLLGNEKTIDDLTCYSDQVIVSHGGDGFTYYSSSQKLFEAPIKGDPINSVGAGDSLVAGFIYATARGMEISDALKVAKYCASATVYSQEIATLDQIKQYDTTNIL